MFPTTCVTFPPTSLPPTRKSVSSLFTEEKVTPGFVLPAQGPLNLLCKRSGGDAHAGTQPKPTANRAGCSERSGSCTLHLCPAPVTSITRLGHQGPYPSQHFISRRALAFRPQMLVGASPPQESLRGSGAEPLLFWQMPHKGRRAKGDDFHILFFPCTRTSLLGYLSPWLTASLLPLQPQDAGKSLAAAVLPSCTRRFGKEGISLYN